MKRRTALGAIGIGAFSASRGFAQSQEVVTIATSPVDSAAEPYYANDMGFFSAAGLDVQLQAGTSNGAAIAAAVASGGLDVGVSNVVSIAQAHARNIPFVVIGAGGLYSSRTPSTVLFVPSDSTVRAAADLNGKTIAVNTLRALPQYGTQAWIDAHGGRSASVNFIEIGPADMLVALKQGRVDAGAFVEPFVTPARAIGRALCAPFDAIAPAFLITACFTTRDWAQAHVDAVRRLQVALRNTARWANANHDRSGDILMKYAKLKPETLQTMLRTVFAERIEVGQVQPLIDLAAKYGGIQRFPASEILFST